MKSPLPSDPVTGRAHRYQLGATAPRHAMSIRRRRARARCRCLDLPSVSPAVRHQPRRKEGHAGGTYRIVIPARIRSRRGGRVDRGRPATALEDAVGGFRAGAPGDARSRVRAARPLPRTPEPGLAEYPSRVLPASTQLPRDRPPRPRLPALPRPKGGSRRGAAHSQKSVWGRTAPTAR
jgi:hypothetical protein